MRNPIHMRAARRAAEISGGTGPLGAYLKASPLVVSGWIEGLDDVPPDVLLKLLDIILGTEEPRTPAPISRHTALAFRYRAAANS